MIGLSLKTFTGEIPRSPPNLLPGNAASYSKNCDFAYGDLRPLKSPAASGTLNSYNTKSIFTEDGVGFYTWPGNVETVKGPVINDQYRRLYYTLNDGAETRFVSMTEDPPIAGGKTPVGYSLGVVGPDATLGGARAATPLNLRALNYDAAVATVAGYYQLAPSLSFKVKFFYADGAKRYQETDLPITSVAPWPTYFAAPQSYPKYSDGTGGSVPIMGRDFQCKVPAREPYVESVQSVTKSIGFETDVNGTLVPIINTTDETSSTGCPDTAVPVLHIECYAGTKLIFSVYSDGTDMASNNTSSSATGGVTLITPWLGNNEATGILIGALKYGVVESRAYVYTYVNKFGEEGANSLPVSIDVAWAQTVEAYGTFKQMGAGLYAPVNTMRFYATNTNSQGATDYYFDEEKQIATTMPAAGATLSFSFSLPNTPDKYGERLTTQDYLLPPAGCTGFVALPNGFLAAHVDTDGGSATGKGMNTLYFTEPYHPHAFPYSMTFPWDIVGICPMGNGLLVTTKGHPFYVYGAHPDSMSQVKINEVQAGISKQSMVDAGSAAAYASNDGLVMVDGSNASLSMSQRFFTREKWRELYGSNLQYLRLAFHDGCLVGYFTNGATGFVIRLDEATMSFTRWNPGTYAGHFVSPVTDKLYLIAGNTLNAFADGSYGTAEWQSKEIIVPSPINFGVLQIVPSQSITGTADVFADGVITDTVTLSGSDSMVFRLSAGFRARSWYVSIDANCPVQEVNLATSMQELKRV